VKYVYNNLNTCTCIHVFVVFLPKVYNFKRCYKTATIHVLNCCYCLLLECLRFTLEEAVGVKVDDTVPANKTFIANHIGGCFLSCFDRPDCLTFTFEASTNTCKVYTKCGTNCLSLVATGVTTYKRHCFTGWVYFNQEWDI